MSDAPFEEILKVFKIKNKSYYILKYVKGWGGFLGYSPFPVRDPDPVYIYIYIYIQYIYTSFFSSAHFSSIDANISAKCFKPHQGEWKHLHNANTFIPATCFTGNTYLTDDGCGFTCLDMELRPSNRVASILTSPLKC